MWLCANSIERRYRKHNGRQQRLTWYLAATVRGVLIPVASQCMNEFAEVQRSHHRALTETPMMKKNCQRKASIGPTLMKTQSQITRRIGKAGEVRQGKICHVCVHSLWTVTLTGRHLENSGRWNTIKAMALQGANRNL